jgi:inner membrane protein
MLWWIWILLGFALLLHELKASGAFISLFFAAGAIFVGLLVALGVAGPLWIQLLFFSVSSVASLLILRQRLLARFRRPERLDLDSVIGRVAVAVEPIPCGCIGKTELRGSVWSAKNAGHQHIGTAERCNVIGIDGLQLQVTTGNSAGMRVSSEEEI